MHIHTKHPLVAVSTAAALATLSLCATGCVQSRPSRNGVFNENQYVKKSFLTRAGDDPNGKDPGWMMRTTITAVSTPNPLGADIFLTPGLENGGALVRFQITEDHLQLLNQRELDSRPNDGKVPEVVNSWPVTNVDLKYKVNLDGETTNFYEENQELDWQVRQFVKVKFAKNDMSDVAPFGGFMTDALALCTDLGNAAVTLVPGSFHVDEAADPKDNYMEWTVSITTPLKWTDTACLQAYGELGVEAAKFGRNSVTFNLKYSFMRATPTDQLTYVPLEIAEKDQIRHKYGFFDYTLMARDNSTGQLGARQLLMRFDPQKPIVWYFAPGFPDGTNGTPNYKAFFTDGQGDLAKCGSAACNTIACQTNCLMAGAGAAARVSFKNFDQDLPDGQRPRSYGDVRYNILYWLTDRDTQGGFAGLTQFTTDPRTGESVSASIVFNDFAVKDYYIMRLDAYLQTISDGSLTGNILTDATPWPDPPSPAGTTCSDGDTVGIVPANVTDEHNAKSTVYGKMQQYLQKPVSLYGYLGPQDFVATQDEDFYKAYYAVTPYFVYADPDNNQFVTPEGGNGVYGPASAAQFWQSERDEYEFQQTMAKIDRGEEPFQAVTSTEGLKNATNFLNRFRTLTLNHKYNDNVKLFIGNRQRMHMDAPDDFSLESVVAHDARHCINGHWETKQEWVNNLITTYWSQVAWHEFGHSVGLTHNFMASVDKNNFPVYMDGTMRAHYGLYASSVMEYNSSPDRVFWKAGWAPYDQGAISWIYANSSAGGQVACKLDPDCGNGACDCRASGGTCDGTKPGVCRPNSITGQLAATLGPWKDPKGFKDDGNGNMVENVFLMCNEYHQRYTPLCRAGDLGATPSQIIANQIDAYEWTYAWRNFRQYHKYWDNSAYGSAPANLFISMRRFLSLWAFDWGSGELSDDFRRIGIKSNDPKVPAQKYYAQLTNKFNLEASQANQMVAAYHKAIIQQSTGERGFRTVFDKFYGDTTQQGIILDKLFSMQGFVGLWPTDNYDQNQAGTYFTYYEGLGDSTYDYVSRDVVTSMVGGQYDVYPYFVPLAVAQFAQDTHNPAFFGARQVRQWIGGWRWKSVRDFLDFFRNLAVKYNNYGCTDIRTCTYDPRDVSDTHNEFIGPDREKWIWAYIPDRDQYVAVQKEFNTASYIIVRNYNDYVVFQMDDGAFPGGAYGTELQVNYFLDAFDYYNG